VFHRIRITGAPNESGLHRVTQIRDFAAKTFPTDMLRYFREFLQWRRGDCINAAVQRRHPDSLLNWTERIIRMRKEVPEIGWGDFKVLRVRDQAVLALRYDWRDNSVLFLHNLHEQPREILLDLGIKDHGELLINLLAEDHSKADESGKHRIVLEGYGYRWYRVGGLDYLLRRTAIGEVQQATH
jgi:Ni/Co efflux regulator RcnB